jgi:hypothetical protein
MYQKVLACQFRRIVNLPRLKTVRKQLIAANRQMFAGVKMGVLAYLLRFARINTRYNFTHFDFGMLLQLWLG